MRACDLSCVVWKYNVEKRVFYCLKMSSKSLFYTDRIPDLDDVSITSESTSGSLPTPLSAPGASFKFFQTMITAGDESTTNSVPSTPISVRSQNYVRKMAKQFEQINVDPINMAANDRDANFKQCNWWLKTPSSITCFDDLCEDEQMRQSSNGCDGLKRNTNSVEIAEVAEENEESVDCIDGLDENNSIKSNTMSFKDRFEQAKLVNDLEQKLYSPVWKRTALSTSSADRRYAHRNKF